MPPRASWTGQLKISFVTVPVRLYNAISSSSRIALNQLHKSCNSRIRNQTVCPQHGEVDRSDLVKGYEFEKGKYVVVEESDLEQIKLESNKTIEIKQFIKADELDPILLNAAYYVAPDGPMAQEAFAVIREGMAKAKVVGIGQVVMANKEQIVALEVQDRGFRVTTLRYAGEVRKPDTYFEDISSDHKIRKEEMNLALQLIENQTGAFDPAAFTDRYQDALLQVIKAKIDGTEPVIAQQAEVGKVINLMDALRQSVEQQTKKKPAAKSIKTAARKKAKKKRA